jgi:hypothetical protein
MDLLRLASDGSRAEKAEKEPATIQALKPAVRREEAVELFRGCGIRGLLRRLGAGRLHSLADAYVPFSVYRVEVVNGAKRETHCFALDAVKGTLDPYAFPRVPEPWEMVPVETRNRALPVLDPFWVRELLTEKVRRMLFQRGFFRIRNLIIRAEPISLDLHIPYWIGFYDAGGSVRLRVLDAVRGTFEGGKAQAFFHDWLSGEEEP